MKHKTSPHRSGRPRGLELLEQRRLLAATLPVVDKLEDPHAGHNHDEVYPDWFDHQFIPVTQSLTRPGEYLTAPSNASALDVAMRFLIDRHESLGLDGPDVQSPVILSTLESANNGLTYIYARQEFNGLQVLNATANFAVDKQGRLLAAHSAFVNAPMESGLPNRPQLSLTQALASVATQFDIELKNAPAYVKKLGGTGHRASSPELSIKPIDGRLVYVAMEDGTMELAWHFDLDMPDGENWWELGVSARTGQIVFAANYVAHATYNAFPSNYASPHDGPRQLLVNPHLVVSSPFGWHDTNGIAGPEFTNTRGNNVDAYLDRDSTNGNPTATDFAEGGTSLIFDFNYDPTQSPLTTSNQKAAVTNLFVQNNWIHDISAIYGFDEAAGNFQTTNYSGAPGGGDSVQAEAQDSSGTNNANMATPADGSRPRMQMYIWTNTTPNRDGDFDQQIIFHEYTHGISNRLTGGRTNSSALSQWQSRSMGEGWSDFVAIALTAQPGDVSTTSIHMSPWALGNSNNGPGIRTYPYTTDMNVNPFTIGDTNGSDLSPHFDGSIWGTVLWEVYWALTDRHGYDADLTTGYTAGGAGNKLALQLVLDGMKLQPTNPSYTQARDAILQADLALTGGENQQTIWRAFAKRGLGYSAVATNASSSGSATVVEAFDFPSPNPFVKSSPLLVTGIAPSFIELEFNEPIDPASFSLADDVDFFMDPFGASLMDSITSAGFTSPTILRIDFSTQLEVGSYQLKLGPGLAAADDGSLIDQNLDGLAGNADDAFLLTLNYNPYKGPDAYNYSAGPFAFENINLVAGGPGVVTLFSNDDDATAAVNLGSSTFNFYGTNYSTIHVNTNGLINFGSGTNAYTNTDLATSPTQASIAVLWDDWRTNFASNDYVLYRFDDLDTDGTADRLVIEWSDVWRYGQTSGSNTPATFQAILELNTGSAAGSITLNYVDVNVNNPDLNTGKSATVGIKDTVTTTGRRLLLSQDGSDTRWVADGRAVRIATDVVAPRVLTSTFEYETGQTVALTISEDISSSLAAGTFQLVNTTTGDTVPGANLDVTYDAGTNTLRVANDIATGLLADGHYVLTFDNLTDAAGMPLDGNRDGLPGGAGTFEFDVLAGDADRDGTVGFSDLLAVGRNFDSAGTWSDGDFNLDGDVDFADLLILARAFGNSAAAVAAPTSPFADSIIDSADREESDLLA